MATNFPTSLDALTNPSDAGGDKLNTAGVLHDEQHANANDAVEALEAKVGVDGSTVATSLDYLVKQPMWVDLWLEDTGTSLNTGHHASWLAPFALTVTAVEAWLYTVASSGTPTFDVNEEGVSILSTKLTIDATERSSRTAAVPAVISDAAIASGAHVSVDVDAAGSGATGGRVRVYFTRA